MSHTTAALIGGPSAAVLWAPTWPMQGRVVGEPLLLRRVDWGGNGRVRGTVKVKGTPDAPVQRLVRLVREIDGVCVAQTISNANNGTYSFAGFDPGLRYTVLAYDLPGGFRAAVASGVQPEPLL